MKHLLTINTLTIFLVGFLCLFQVAAVLAAPGDLDTSFAEGGKSLIGFSTGDDVANAAAGQPDGKLVVVGSAGKGTDSDFDFLVIRYNTDGSLDTSFDEDGKVITPVGRGDAVATAVAIQADGKIVVAGYGVGNTNYDFAVVRYNPDGSLDPFFGINGIEITAVSEWRDEGHAIAIQTNGKIVVAGRSLTNNFDSDFAVARYNPDGSPDTTFAGRGSIVTPLGTVITEDEGKAVAVQADGKIVVVGRGRGIGIGGSFIAIVRYTIDGFLDNSFFVQGKGTYRFGNQDAGNAVTLQPDGKILLAGISDENFFVMRFNTNGTFDNSFNGNGRAITPVGPGFDEAKAVMLTGSSVQRIVVAGFASNGANKDFAVVRYNLDGSLDTSFNGTGKVITPIGAGDAEANAVATQAGLLVAAGSTFNGSNKDVAVVRYNPDGSPDTSFDGDGKRIDDVGIRTASARGVALQADGKVVVAGYSGTDTNGDDFAVARYNSDGTLDDSFDDDGKVTTDFGGGDQGFAVTIQPDGKIVVAGSSSMDSTHFAVARYNRFGSPDTSFNGNGRVITPIGSFESPRVAVALQTDGKIVVAGTARVGSGKNNFGVVRYNANGSLDNSFGDGGRVITPIGSGSDFVAAVRIQADGKIVVAGQTHNGVDEDFAVVRYNPDGSLDNSFGSFGKQITPIGVGGDIGFGMALQADGKIVVAGHSFNGFNIDFAVVRYTANGSPDTSFDGDGTVTTPIGFSHDVGTAVAIQPDGKILVAGAAVIGSKVDFAVVRCNPDGSLDSSFGNGGKLLADVSGLTDIGWAIALDSVGRAVVAGDANELFGVVRILADSDSAPAPPRITGASVKGRKLFVQGQGFDAGAAILLNDEPQNTKNNAQNPAGRLIGKRAGLKIGVGATVRLKVRNADGTESAEFSYTRPAQ